ncbi:membrane protein [Ralstonia solanacearum]|nr:membrane protein [Ralstonia solanacearum P673]OAI69102.1 membrane protein [Ralstonia solanacearum]
MSVAAACVAAIPHADIPLPFKDGAWMLHMAGALIFMVGAIDSLFLLFYTRRKP